MSTEAEILDPDRTAGAAAKSTYGEILKSSALVGGSQVLTIGIGIIRTKVLAVLLGPGGMGLFGLYNSIADLVQSIAGMGVNNSGVRQIAEAAGCDDVGRMGRTAAVLRWTSLALGTFGAVALAACATPISRLTFGSSRYSAAVSMLSIVVFFKLVSAGQGALIQGTRRIADLASMGVLGAVFGTLAAIPLVYFLREDGIVPSLITVAATTIATSWWYSRKIDVRIPSITAGQVREEAASLLKLGFAFMASGLMTMGSAYAIRIIVRQKIGFAATGLYQSAWTLGGLYVGFILQAMGADFYPRLTARANDNRACNRMVNEQARIGLLMAGPGVIGTLTFTPLIIALLYSPRFREAVDVLRWICLGVMLRVVTWPMGFIILAKAKQSLFFWSELAWTVVNLGAAWFCVGAFGLTGAGIAFVVSYVFHGCLIYAIVSRLSGFAWSDENLRTGAPLLGVVASVFAAFYVLPFRIAVSYGAVAALCTGIYSVRCIARLASADLLPGPIRRFAANFGLNPES